MNLYKTTAAALAIVLALPVVVAGPILAEKIGDHTTRFYESAEARESAEPSYALLSEPNSNGPSPAATAGTDFNVNPSFTTAKSAFVVSVEFPPGTSFFGTGEVTGPLLRNGRTIATWNTDAYGYGNEAKSLYKSHPWVLAVMPDGKSVGMLADTTYRCDIDTGAASANTVRFSAESPHAFPLITIERSNPADVVKELARLTGTMPLPPKWALGYHQCRYSYYPEARAREIAREFRERKIPCDVIWYDIDYMEAFRIFSFDRGYFPDPKKLNDDLLGMGFHNVWMIDPGVKSRKERGKDDRPQADLDKEPQAARDARAKELAKFDAMVASGTAADVWVHRKGGKVFEGEVWPGWCFFPDYTQPRVRDEWWAALYKDFMAQGITGVWNDMNEPAVFNVASKTMPLDNVHLGDPAMIAPNGKAQGARNAKGPHSRYHNVYGLSMVRGTWKGIQEANPDVRPFVLSRAVFIGGQRYAAGWSGDNSADWAHLEESIPMVLNMGLSAFPLYGPDIGGFAGNGDAKLFSRWFGLGTMLPFSRGHTGKGNIDKEPWAFGPEVEKTCREALERRYRLIPYLYTLAQEASTLGLPIARPTFFTDPTDPALRSEDDSFLLGDNLLVVASILPDGSRVPVMPKGLWAEIMLSGNADLPHLFVKGGGIVPTGPIVQYVGEKPLGELSLLICLDENGKASGTFYDDAGDGYGYQKGDFRLSHFVADVEGDELVVRESSAEGSRPRSWKSIKVEALTPAGREPAFKSVRVSD